ncbi:MAG: carboxypeptidase-like regulatory domain-containing protein [Bacteroidales bacterium]|jgi:hypothetical protein|nr:carboxypeptidase-like regulatory domain-containing protein [Bacteroidales bacterium]
MNNRIYLLLFLSIFLFAWMLSSPLFGQQYVIKGTIVDSLSQEKLFYVNVGLTITDSTATMICYSTTDQEGNFSLATRKGDYHLKLSYASIGAIVRPLTIDGSQDTLDLGTIIV